MLIFFFTDIEGSTRLWEKHPEQMGRMLARHDALLAEEIERHGGEIFKHTGDGVLAVFAGGRPLHCALAVQKAFAAEDWGVGEVRVRLALHAGQAERRDRDYFGPVVNRTARLLAAGWGGQILFTPEVLRVAPLPEGATWQDLGFHFFKDLGWPQQVYMLFHPDLPLGRFPPLRSLSAHPHNLPPQPTPFLGREKELAEVICRLADPACRLLTLVGPGGTGKTRLALQAAAEQVEAFPHGVYFVALAPLDSPDLIVSTTADALRFSFYSTREPRAQLLDYLREKRMLLVMDNFEHLTEGADLLVEILQAAPAVKVLVTSRERLRLHGEWVFPVGGLEIPPDEGEEEVERYSAGQLFLGSARRIRPDFVPDWPAIARLCRLLEGLPLGIELAASWVQVLSCQEILQEVESSLDILDTPWRDLPERHRSLRAVFDYSWALLSERERQVLARLSVFQGGFRREAAREVADASLPLLSTLLDKSLLRHAAGRYDMLEVLRQYAAEKLGERPAEEEEVKVKHGLFYLRFLKRCEERLKGGQEKEALEEMQREMGNIRKAWQWAVEQGRWEEIGRAVESLYLFYEMRSMFHEGRQTFRRAVEMVRRPGREKEQPEAVLGRLLARYGWCCERLSCYQEAQEAFAESLEIARRQNDREELVFIQTNLGSILYRMGEYERSRHRFQESLDLARQGGSPWRQAHVLNNLGILASTVGEVQEARPFYEESLALFRQIGYRRGIANTLNNLGVLASTSGEYEEANRLYRESLDFFHEIGDRRGSAFALANRGHVSAAQGEYGEAEQLSLKGLALFREIGDRWGVANTLCNLGNIAIALKEYPAGLRYLRQALEIAADLQATPLVLEALVGMAQVLFQEGALLRSLRILATVLHQPGWEREALDQAEHLLDRLRAALSPDAVASALEEGRQRSVEQVLEEVLSGEPTAPTP